MSEKNHGYEISSKELNELAREHDDILQDLKTDFMDQKSPLDRIRFIIDTSNQMDHPDNSDAAKLAVEQFLLWAMNQLTDDEVKILNADLKSGETQNE